MNASCRTHASAYRLHCHTHTHTHTHTQTSVTLMNASCRTLASALRLHCHTYAHISLNQFPVDEFYFTHMNASCRTHASAHLALGVVHSYVSRDSFICCNQSGRTMKHTATHCNALQHTATHMHQHTLRSHCHTYTHTSSPETHSKFRGRHLTLIRDSFTSHICISLVAHLNANILPRKLVQSFGILLGLIRDSFMSHI